MGRYDLPDPKCKHVRKGRVTAGDLLSGPHASTSVCDRPPCIEDAKEWATAQTGLEAVYVPDMPARERLANPTQTPASLRKEPT